MDEGETEYSAVNTGRLPQQRRRRRRRTWMGHEKWEEAVIVRGDGGGERGEQQKMKGERQSR